MILQHPDSDVSFVYSLFLCTWCTSVYTLVITKVLEPALLIIGDPGVGVEKGVDSLSDNLHQPSK